MKKRPGHPRAPGLSYGPGGPCANSSCGRVVVMDHARLSALEAESWLGARRLGRPRPCSLGLSSYARLTPRPRAQSICKRVVITCAFASRAVLLLRTRTTRLCTSISEALQKTIPSCADLKISFDFRDVLCYTKVMFDTDEDDHKTGDEPMINLIFSPDPIARPHHPARPPRGA